MFEVFETIRRLFVGLRSLPAADACGPWLRDPMAHPHIAVMDGAALADLPTAQLRARLRE